MSPTLNGDEIRALLEVAARMHEDDLLDEGTSPAVLDVCRKAHELKKAGYVAVLGEEMNR